MKLPDRFQMRHKDYQGFTHVVKKTENGYSVKWARGYAERMGVFPNTTFREQEVLLYVQMENWIVVDEAKSQEQAEPARSASLPDLFYFQHSRYPEASGKVTKVAGGWNLLWDGEYEASFLSAGWVPAFIKRGDWKIIDKKPLTPEQIRTNKDIQEQINALNSSIKLNEQDISHKQRLIDSYEERKSILQSKIVEA